MNIEEIKQFLADNKEDEQVKQFVEGLQQDNRVDVQRIEQLAQEDDSIKAWLDSQKDKHASKSLETWKQNNLEKLVNDEVKKRNPQETPEQARIRELEEYVQQKEREALLQTNKNKALNVLNEKGLPSNLVDFFITDNEDTTLENLSQFEEVFTNQLQQAVENRLKQDGTNLHNNDGKSKTFTKDEVQGMSTQEINENWDDIKDIIGQEE